MYDATLTQFVGWYDDSSVGGIQGSVDAMLKADPTFVLGHCLAIGLDVESTGNGIRVNEKLNQDLQQLVELAQRQQSSLTKREQKHVEAVVRWSKQDIYGAAQCYEDILIESPMDMHAIRMAYDAYFFLGCQIQQRDLIARSLPFWQSNAVPLKEYLHGMYAFGLEETNFYRKAELEALKGLERNPKDAWATHSLAHVFEMEGRTEEGIKFLQSTENDWTFCNHLAAHNYWHLALYFIEKGDYEEADSIFSGQILSRAEKTASMLDIVDSCSLLYRIELSKNQLSIGGGDRESKWRRVYACCKPHLSDHLTAFNDAHYIMSLLGANKYDEADELLGSISDELEQQIVGRSLVRPLLQSMIAYEREKYAEAVDLLMPIRYDLVKIGGSNAKRDVFNQLLVLAAIKSPLEKHRKLAEHLLIEREALKSNSGLTDRLLFKLNAKQSSV